MDTRTSDIRTTDALLGLGRFFGYFKCRCGCNLSLKAWKRKHLCEDCFWRT